MSSVDTRLTTGLFIAPAATSQGVPAFSTSQCTSTISGTTAVVGWTCVRCLLGVLAICAAEEATEERSKAGKTASNDANVELNAGPDGDVAGVPKPVAEFTVVGDITQLDESGRAGKDTETQNSKECYSCSEMNVELP